MCIFVPQSSLVGSTGVNFFTLDQLERFGMTREELLSNRRQPLWKFSENQNFVWTFKGIYGEQGRAELLESLCQLDPPGNCSTPM